MKSKNKARQEIKDVHTEHCCIDHGCKYGEDETCTVVQKIAKQSYPCEMCDELFYKTIENGTVVSKKNPQLLFPLSQKGCNL